MIEFIGFAKRAAVSAYPLVMRMAPQELEVLLTSSRMLVVQVGALLAATANRAAVTDVPLLH